MRYRDLPSNFWLLMLGVFVMRVGQFMVLPFFAILVRQQLHASAITVGLVVATGPFCYAISSFNSGHLVDKFGAKTVLLCSLLFGAIGFAAMYMLNSLPAYFLLSMMLGFTRSAFNAAANAYIFLTVDEKLHRLAYGSNYIMINVGFAVGLLIGTVFAMYHSKLLFVSIAAIYGILAVFIKWVLPAVRGNVSAQLITFKNTIATVFADRRLLYLTLAMLVLWLAYSQIDSVLPMYLADSSAHGALNYAEIIIVNGVMASVLQVFTAKLMQRVSFMKQVVLATVFLMLGYLCYVLFTGIIWYMVGMAIITLAELILLPLFDVWIGQLANRERAGAYYAAGNFYMLGAALGPVLGSIIYQYWGIKMTFAVCIIISLFIVPLFAKALPDTKKATE